jgi:hypothetical protein
MANLNVMRFLWLLFFLYNALDAFGQPPSLVTNAFHAKYPSARQVQWTNQSDEYKATFQADGFNYETKYNSKGDWKVSQRQISYNDIPQQVKNTFKKSDYAQWTPQMSYVLFFPGMITQYRIIVGKNGNDKSLLFSHDGKLLKDNFSF